MSIKTFLRLSDSKPSRETTRREFLKDMTTTAAAAAIGAAGWRRLGAEAPNRHYFKVFSEGRIGPLLLKNRLIRAATLERAGLEGNPAEHYLNLHKTQAAGGVSLIITGAMAPMSPGMLIQIHAFDDRHIPGLQKIAALVHETDNSCKIIAQLVGFGEGVGPSAISWPDEQPVRALSIDEIETLVKRFAEAIRRVKDGGFDGAEINGHYVYLISSFLSPHTNKRNDKYGGSVEKRVRIIREIVEMARGKVGQDFPILIKVNCDDSFSPNMPIQDGTNIENFPQLAAEIEKAGVDAIELSGNNLIREEIDSVDKESYFLKYAEALDIRIPVILTGGNRSIESLEKIIKKGKVEFFGLARPLIREPDLANRWLTGTGSGTAKCISCNGCLSADGVLRCVQEKA